eukprot:TRINITY_DN32266_c0_g1_i1.p1 TRINITY_DN32266_c0_g1~~TRINITY_DN32266_c0_g1_i1.p1  ORF type:complete len:1819 (+),score=389.91 TRINITY_DN32266_c0_g1_i1:50-5506(+)
MRRTDHRTGTASSDGRSQSSAADAVDESVDREFTALVSRVGARDATILALRSLKRHLAADTILTMLDESDQSAGEHAAAFSRFAGGATDGDEWELDGPSFYTPAEPLRTDAASLSRQVASWRGYCEDMWDAEEREDIVGTCAAVTERSGSRPGGEAVALYTMMACKRAVWAFAKKDSWAVFPEHVCILLEAALQHRGDDLVLSVRGAVSKALSQTLPHVSGLRELPLERGHEVDMLHGAVWPSKVDGRRRLFRFDNMWRGDPNHSPLHDTVAWLVRPDPATPTTFESEQARLPCAGILETLQSLSVYDDTAVMPAGYQWKHGPSLGQSGEMIAGLCLRERNQEAFNATLRDRWLECLRVAAATPAAVSRAMVGDVARPTPALLLHGVELQWLGHNCLTLRGLSNLGTRRHRTQDTVRNGSQGDSPNSRPPKRKPCCVGRRAHFALSGARKVMALEPMEGEDQKQSEIVLLQRLDRESVNQMYYVLNSAMRNAQAKREYVSLMVTGPRSGDFEAPVPPGWQGGAEGLPVLVEDATARMATWSQEEGWTVDGTVLEPTADAELNLGTLMLAQVTPMIQQLDMAVSAMEKERAPDRLYRGLAGVRLDPSRYGVGRVVLWSSYSSCSADMSVAVGFTSSGDSAVFSILGAGAVRLSRGSRFAREREWLFPGGTLFTIDSSLSTEFAELLGKERLQLYELRVVSKRQAKALQVRQMLSRVHGSGLKCRVAGLYSVAEMLEDESIPVADVAHALMAHGTGTLGSPESKLLFASVCEMAELEQSTVLSQCMQEAAKAGASAAVRDLVAEGVDVRTRFEDGSMPLHLAAASGCADCTEELLLAGAQPNVRDGDGRLPCDVAHSARAHDTVRLLAKWHPLPRRLQDKYQKMSGGRCCASSLVAMLLIITLALVMSLDLVSIKASKPLLQPDAGRLLGLGECAGDWGGGMDYVQASVSNPQECFDMMKLPNVSGVMLASLTECDMYLTPRNIGTRRMAYPNRPLSITPQRVAQLFGKKQCSMCWTDNVEPTPSFLYFHLANAPDVSCQGPLSEGCGYAPAEPGVACPAHLSSGERGVWGCTDGSNCSTETCCRSRGGVSRCPLDKPVHCADCSTGRCCAEDVIDCVGQRAADCSDGPFLPCINQERVWSCSSVPTSFCSTVDLHGVMCPQSCQACPGSVPAEFLYMGGATLLHDGVVSGTGQGCISIAHGIKIVLPERYNITELVLSVFGSVELVEVAGDDDVWVATELQTRAGVVVATLPQPRCVQNFKVRTSARVCELTLQGRRCPSLFQISERCLTPGSSIVWGKEACDLAGKDLGVNVTWRDGPAVPDQSMSYNYGISSCTVQMQVTNTRNVWVSVCVARPHEAYVNVQPDPTPGRCYPDVEDPPRFHVIPRVSYTDCAQTLRQWAGERLASKASSFNSELTQVSYCLLYVSSNVPLGSWESQTDFVPQEHLAVLGPTIALPGRNGTTYRLLNHCYKLEEVNCEAECRKLAECAVFFINVKDKVCAMFSNVTQHYYDTDGTVYLKPSHADKLAITVGPFYCYDATVDVPAPDAGDKYRVSLTGKCPAGTTELTSMEECEDARGALALPSGPVEYAPTAHRGCTFLDTLRFRPKTDEALPNHDMVFATVCKQLPPIDQAYSAIDLAKSDFTDVRILSTACNQCLGIACTMLILWLVLMCRTLRCGCVMAMTLLNPMQTCIGVLSSIGSVLALIAAGSMCTILMDQCDDELRPECDVQWQASAGWAIGALVLTFFIAWLPRMHYTAKKRCAEYSAGKGSTTRSAATTWLSPQQSPQTLLPPLPLVARPVSPTTPTTPGHRPPQLAS